MELVFEYCSKHFRKLCKLSKSDYEKLVANLDPMLKNYLVDNNTIHSSALEEIPKILEYCQEKRKTE